MSDILRREVDYLGGDVISVARLEAMIHSERSLQDQQVIELNALRDRNSELQENLVSELSKLRYLSEELSKQQTRSGFLRTLRSFFAKLRGEPLTRKSIEDLLRRQYELSARRTKEAAELSDRLKMAESQLRDEIERLNDKIIESARNEERAAAYVKEVQAHLVELEAEQFIAEQGSARARELQADVDRAKRVLHEHATMLKLYSTAEDRLARLQDNTRQLAETIGHLESDLTLYVTAASEKLDLIAGQIQAIGAAADASVVMLEMKRILDALTESINHATRFVSETQSYFRSHVDHLVDDLELYDSETQAVLTGNLGMSEALGDMGLAEAIGEAFHDADLAEEIEEAHADAADEREKVEVPVEVPAVEEEW